MKRIAWLLAAALMVGIPAFAADPAPTQAQKDECLLYSKNCMNQADTLMQKIKKLDNEIKKGTKVYTPEELKRLNAKLKEAEDLVDELIHTH